MRSREGLTGAIVGVRTEREAVEVAEAVRWDAPPELIRAVDDAVARFDAVS